MGKRYLIDSNVIIDYAANRLPLKSGDFLENVFNTDFLISVIVKIEVLGFADFQAKRNSLEDFLGLATVLPLDENVAGQTISLRQNIKKLKLGDAIICATALIHNLSLITRNISDFKNIPNLAVIDPYSIS